MATLSYCGAPSSCQRMAYNADLHDVASQYGESEKLKGYIASFVEEAKQAAASINDLSVLLNPGCISGAALDLLGEIVGQPRPLIGGDLKKWFAYNDDGSDTLTGGYGVGAYWDGKAPLVGGAPADDVTYRVFILARIARNTFRGTHNELLAAVRMITCRDDIRIVGTNGEDIAAFAYDGDDGTAGGYGVGAYVGDGTPAAGSVMEISLVGTKRPIETIFQYLFLQYDILPIPAGVKLVSVQ